jgi:hypothetical protein
MNAIVSTLSVGSQSWMREVPGWVLGVVVGVGLAAANGPACVEG